MASLWQRGLVDLRAAGDLQRRDADPGDATAVEFGDRQQVPGDLDGGSDARQLAQGRDDVAGDGLVRSVGQLHAGLVVEVLEVEQAIDVRARAQRLGVVLIPNVANELLDEILEGHDAGGPAVLVDDDGQVLA